MARRKFESEAVKRKFGLSHWLAPTAKGTASLSAVANMV